MDLLEQALATERNARFRAREADRKYDATREVYACRLRSAWEQYENRVAALMLKPTYDGEPVVVQSVAQGNLSYRQPSGLVVRLGRKSGGGYQKDELHVFVSRPDVTNPNVVVKVFRRTYPGRQGIDPDRTIAEFTNPADMQPVVAALLNEIAKEIAE